MRSFPVIARSAATARAMALGGRFVRPSGLPSRFAPRNGRDTAKPGLRPCNPPSPAPSNRHAHGIPGEFRGRGIPGTAGNSGDGILNSGDGNSGDGEFRGRYT